MFTDAASSNGEGTREFLQLLLHSETETTCRQQGSEEFSLNSCRDLCVIKLQIDGQSKLKLDVLK